VNEFIETNLSGTWDVFTRLLNYHVHYGLAIEFDSEKMSKGITLSTIHGSKGLEYNQVYVMGCTNQQWESARNANNKVGIPKPMYQYLNKSADELEDFRRLIYVAFTRAKNQLSFSYVENGNKAISTILADVMPLLSQTTTMHPAMDLQRLCGETRALSLSPDLRTAWEQSWLKFEFTASSLNAYISDPEKFIWHSFFKIPDLPDEAMSFGSAVHLALEELIKEGSHKPLTDGQIAVKWESSINTGKHLFDPLHFRQYMNYGLKILFDYFQNNPLNQSSKEHITEAYLHGQLGSVKIAGKIDLIEIRGNAIKAIDYKTGSGYNQLKPFESISSPGDAYWRQAAIYAELIRQNYPDKQLESVQFQFVEKGSIITAQVVEENTHWKTFCEEISSHICNHRVFKYVAPNYFSTKQL
jgi:DNA helicase-2/ATP-dependent DNA helicase PcrA